MGASDSPARTVQATDTTFAILETLNEAEGMRLTALADELDMAKSTVHRYLQTLLARKYVVKEDDVYYLGLRFLDFGENVRNRKEGYQMCKTKVTELAEETEERAQFIVEEHGDAVYVHREAGSNAVHTDPGIGKRTHLHATSAGKAIMAEWPADRVQAYLHTHGLPGQTPHTITDPETLRAELETISERGYSVNSEENITGLRAIGVAVADDPGDVLGALSVSGPMHRMSGDWFEEALPDLLMGIANEIQLNLQHS